MEDREKELAGVVSASAERPRTTTFANAKTSGTETTMERELGKTSDSEHGVRMSRDIRGRRDGRIEEPPMVHDA